MKPLIWLTIWQAVAVNVEAIPHRRRHMAARQATDVCEASTTSTPPDISTTVLPETIIALTSGKNQPVTPQGQLTVAGAFTIAGNNGGSIVQVQHPASTLVPQAASGNSGNLKSIPTAVAAQPSGESGNSNNSVAQNLPPVATATLARGGTSGTSANLNNPVVDNTTPAALQSSQVATVVSRNSAQASDIVPTRTESTDAYGVIWIGEETPATGISVVAGEQTPENVIFVPETVPLGASGGIFYVPITTTTVIPSIPVLTTATTRGSATGTAQIVQNTPSKSPATKGTIVTSLNHSASAPVITSAISSPTSLLSAAATPAYANTTFTNPTSVMASMVSDNIFQPVETDAPPSVISSRSDHPVPRLSITPQDSPIGTNKFYANFFLGSQTASAWTHPYSVAWSKGGGTTGSWGMTITHIDSDQKVFGPDASANPVQYFINPIGIQSIVLSEAELGSDTSISIDSITAFSANVNLSPSAGAQPSITFPLVQGMGFVTGIYSGGTPILQSGVFFASVTRANTSPKSGVTKYTIVLNDGKTWLLYAYSPSGDSLEFTVVSNGLVQATSNFNGMIQIAKDPGGDAEALYDAACGVYATTATLSGSVTDDTASYQLSFSKAGTANTTLAMFALPHHVQSFAQGTTLSTVQLATTTKGNATAIVADSWTLVEDIPTTMEFAPWSPSLGSQSTLSPAAIASILTVATSEVSQNMSEQTNLNSMYYSGKALAKFAGIVYTIHDLLGATALAEAGLANLKDSFAVFASNTQIYPLVHETAWGGVVSSASYTTGNSGDDFGNTYYNDHHFHYGYFIYTAAVIGYLDPSWLTDNKAYVNTLVRDIANPSIADNYFPVSRNFDWYHGHSWAHGLYETFDGKDEESSSEDSMSAYAIKMWGRTIGDSNMEARGNLQLAVTARALQNYFLYTSDNTVEPSNFIGNKVSGILFENKIDHTTYFGSNTEYIEGIHMMPLLPSSTLTRTKEFVTEEWNTYFSSGRVDSVVGGWRGILYANLGIIQPSAAWDFFSSSDFDPSLLDGGASRTWYMALAAGWGGAS